MSYHVHHLDDLSDDQLEMLPKLLDPSIRLTDHKTHPDARDYDILISGTPDEAHIKASSRLKALFIPYVGVPGKTQRLMVNYPDIAVHNMHYNDKGVAEMAISLLLAASKRLVSVDREMRKNHWLRWEEWVQLYGKTAVILGYGAIGREIARRCLGLDMNVIGIRKNKAGDDFEGKVTIETIDRLVDLLPRADVLLIALPLTRETKRLIGEKEIGLMPENSILINVGRGPLVDEGALYNSLFNKHLFGAGLDVWFNYPRSEDAYENTHPSSYPFSELDNIVMSPHRAERSFEMPQIIVEELALMLNAAVADKTIPNKVNIEDGY